MWLAHRLTRCAARVFALAVCVGALSSPARTQSATTPLPVTLFGEIRARTEWDRPGGPLAADVYTYLRTRLGIRAAPADGVRIVIGKDEGVADGDFGHAGGAGVAEGG